MGCPGIPSKSGSEFASPKLGCCHCFMMFHDEFIGVQGSAETSNNSERSHDSRNRFSTSEDCNIWEIGNYHVYIYICNYDVHYIFCLGLLEFAMKSMCCHGPPAGCLQKAPCPLSSVWEAQVLIRNGGYPKITSLVGKKMIDHRIFIGT